jgi:dihydroxyacetone kinase-like protein
MKNLMNHVDTIRDESLEGFAAAHADIVALGSER